MNRECKPRSSACEERTTAVLGAGLGLVLAFVLGGPLIASAGDPNPTHPQKGKPMTQAAQTEEREPATGKVTKSDAEWKAELSPAEYQILRKKGTEPAFTGEFNAHKADGTYVCAGCGQALFSSQHKFDSGSGWPSYTQPIRADQVDEHRDSSYGMVRTEVVCSRCGGHLGHVFNDGPAPTGLRYCINSVALDFEPDESAD